MDDLQTLKDAFQKSNQLLQNAQTGPSSGRVPPPIPMTPIPPLMTSTTANNMMPRNFRRVPSQMHYMSPTTSTGYGGAGYGGTYNSYPYRSYMNMNMGGYNPYNSYGQPMTNQFQNPVIIAAAENSRPAFESIQSVVQSFNAVSMMLDSTLTAMQMSFQALLGVAENFTRLRSFMMKLYSTIVSFKLARWFLTKLLYLLRLVRGDRRSISEEDLWISLSATTPEESFSSDNRSWPLIVFTGLLVTTPYLMYKFLNSITPISSTLPTLNANTTLADSTTTSRESLNVAFKAPNDWSYPDSKTMRLVKGQTYFTSKSRILFCSQNGGWLLVDDSHGNQGYVPLSVVKPRKIDKPPSQSLETEISNDITTTIPSMVPEQAQPTIIKMPITDVHDNPISLPHQLKDSNELEKNKK